LNTSSEPIRVLWLAKGLGQGGMERLLVAHARFSDKARFDYRAAHLVDRPHSVVDELRALGVPVDRLGSGSSVDPRWLADLVRTVRRERIDVVHTHSPLPAALSRPLLRTLPHRPRLVYTEHNSWDCYGTTTRLANRVTYALDDARLAVSDPARDSASPRLRRRTLTLVHGIDTAAVSAHHGDRTVARRELGIADGTVVVGVVANLRPEKAYPTLLRAASAVLDARPETVFLSVGQGPLQTELEQEHERLGLGDAFRFLGYRDDVLSVMAAFDVFTLSSDQEGLPVALMEASALGLPVVATAVGGVPSVVTEGVNGLLVAPGDPQALAHALARVVASPELRARLARGSAEAASRFDARAAVRRIEETYLEVLGLPSDARPAAAEVAR